MEALRHNPSTIAEVTFPQKEGGPVTVWHNLKEQPTPFRKYLKMNGADEQLIDTLVDKDGKWIHKVEKEIDPYAMEPEELLYELVGHLDPEYKAVDISLNGIKEEGFNKHDKGHALWVGRGGLELLKQGNYDKDTQRRFVMAAAAHDLGNAFSRKAQSILAPRIFKETFVNLKVTDEDFAIVSQAIERHDEETANWLLEESLASDDSQEDHTKRTKHMQNLFTPEGLALIIADKAAVGRNRLSEKPKDTSAVDRTKHTEVNLLLETSKLGVEGDTFIWNMDYKPEITDEEYEERKAYAMPHSKREGYKAYVSKETQEKYLRDGVLHFRTEVDNFYEIYDTRVYLATEAAFALFKNIDKVSIRFVDSPNKDRPEDKFIIEKVMNRNDRSRVFRNIDADLTPHPNHPSQKHLRVVA
jgi:hypothetical protein